MAKFFGFNIAHNKKEIKRLSTGLGFRSIFTKITVNTPFTGRVQHDFYLNDAITKASSILSLASFRFDKQAEIRDNFKLFQ